MTPNRLSCEDRNECDWHPCGRGGLCYNLEGGAGYWCDCLEGFRCDNCSCEDGPSLRRGTAAVGISNDALLIIVLCIIFYISKLFGNSKISYGSLSSWFITRLFWRLLALEFPLKFRCVLFQF